MFKFQLGLKSFQKFQKYFEILINILLVEITRRYSLVIEACFVVLYLLFNDPEIFFADS